MVESVTSQLLMVEAPCSAGQAPNFWWFKVQTPKPSIWSENRIPSKKWMVEQGRNSPWNAAIFGVSPCHPLRPPSIDVPSKAKARSVARRGRASDSSGERRTAMATELCLEMSWDGRHGMGWGVEMMFCGMWKYVNYRMIAVVPPKKDRKGISATFGLNFAFVSFFGLLYLSIYMIYPYM